MSCYFRHIKEIFKIAGIEVTPENKKAVDRTVHEILETEYKNCPVAWNKLKNEVLSDEKKREVFIRELKNRLAVS